MIYLCIGRDKMMQSCIYAMLAAVSGVALVSSETSDMECSKDQRDTPQPKATGGTKQFLEGETFSLNCTVKYIENNALNLTWKLPNEYIKVLENSNNETVSVDEILFRSIKIVNATKHHAGNYTCYSKNKCGVKTHSFEKIYLDEPYLRVEPVANPDKIIEQQQSKENLKMTISSYPPVNSSHFTYYKNHNIPIVPNKNNTYKEKWNGHDLTFTVTRKTVEDTGNYTIVITNGYQTQNVTYDIRFKFQPVVDFGSNIKICVLNRRTTLQCEVTGYPLPDVEWIFTSNDTQTTMNSTKIEHILIYKERAILDILCTASGNITCKATNGRASIGTSKKKQYINDFQTKRLFVNEMENGFGIYVATKDLWFSENEDVSVTCLASKYEFHNVTWMMDNNEDLGGMVEYSMNQFSLVAKLRINSISLSHIGKYICHGIKTDGKMISDDIYINVAALTPPTIIFTSNIKGDVPEYQPVYINCIAKGVPRPTILWKKDGKHINETNVEIVNDILNRTTVNSTVSITQMKEKHRGTYECTAVAAAQEAKESVKLVYRSDEAAYMKYMIVIAIISVVFVILLIYLICKIKKEKKFRKELAAAGLLYFKEGVTKSINPDLGIDEQAELLPYDEKFEFPSDKLVLGTQLGAGAFGVVYKAEARGISNAEETTTVAVKMVKKTADNMYIKALASELKIMVHLGKHINIVNLLGACTKNVGKRELLVIVEYCKFGNIHNYMQRHREVFIDQFSDNNKEKSFGKVNRGYDSTGSTGVQSDSGTANTQLTDRTFLTNNTNKTSVSRETSEGFVQPEWRSNYESDYSYDGRSPRPLTSRDLLAWAFQIARGMEYLVSRKVLHGDLAARNILLADDNIVKIYDFGLARSVYKNDEYQKKENSSPLPVKWLAIECMTDRIFSTQSDVWSFGIVLWELFSLAKTPYPNISPASLLQYLTEGKRLEKPEYADERIYSLMKRCWELKPMLRPSFPQLQEIIGTFLEDDVRNHYVDLNASYMDSNSRPEGQEDYLAMMNSPDYNNLVTPSPHHYVNELNGGKSFFPNTPTKVDDKGFQPLSPASNNHIFSPKPTGIKFDFDPRKFNSRPSEASSSGSELTPMLTLNNLPRSSDSDHEGNASPSYPNACPGIEEETDEVFETKHYNAKNAQNTAVSNPTYIALDIDIYKKPIDVNNYVNIGPNGLVK